MAGAGWLRSHRLAVAALVTVGYLVLVLVVATRPRLVLADDTEHYQGDGAPLPIAPGTAARRDMPPPPSGFAGVQLRFATYGGSRCGATVSLLRDGGEVILRRYLRCTQMPDNGPVRVVGPRLRAGADRGYTVDVRVAPGAPPLALWASTPLPSTALAPPTAERVIEVVPLVRPRGGPLPVAGVVLRRVAAYGVPWAQAPAVVVAVLLVGPLLGLALAGRGRPAVVAMLLVVLVKGLLWMVLIPPFEAPDEQSHYASAQFIAEAHALPRSGEALQGRGIDSPQVLAVEASLHTYARPPTDRPDFGRRAESMRPLYDRQTDRRSGGDGSAAGYPAPFYAVGAVFYALTTRAAMPGLLGARLFTMLLGVLCAWLAYRIARACLPESEGAARALGLACGLQPMFTQQTSSFNNDSLVITGGFVCLLVALRIARRPTPFTAAFAGLAVGLGMLGKPQAVAFVPVLALAEVIGRVRSDGGWRRWRPWLVDVGAAAGGIAATYGTWFVLATIEHLPMLATGIVPGGHPGTTAGYVRAVIAHRLNYLQLTWVRRFWGEFSWLDTTLPKHTYTILGWLTVVALVLCVAWAAVALTGAVRARRGNGAGPVAGAADDVPALLCTAAVICTLAFLHLAGWLDFKKNGGLFLLQGRYALDVLPAVLVGPVLFVRRLVPRLDVAVVSGAIALGVVALHVTSVGAVAGHFFA